MDGCELHPYSGPGSCLSNVTLSCPLLMWLSEGQMDIYYQLALPSLGPLPLKLSSFSCQKDQGQGRGSGEAARVQLPYFLPQHMRWPVRS